MITNFKLFENNINIGEPQVNDYAITNQHNWENVDPNDPSFDEYQNNCIRFTQDELKFWSKNKEDLNDENIKQYLMSKKYNL